MPLIKQRSIVWDFILTVLSFGLFNIYVQIRQIFDANDLTSDGKFSFTRVIILSLFTFGLYFTYHEYIMTIELHQKLYGEKAKLKNFWVIPATFIGIWPAVDSYQQVLINGIAEGKSDIAIKDIKQLVLVGVLYTAYISLLIFFALAKSI